MYLAWQKTGDEKKKMKLGGIGTRGQAAQSSEMGKKDVKREDGGATGKVPLCLDLKRARNESAKTNDGYDH